MNINRLDWIVPLFLLRGCLSWRCLSWGGLSWGGLSWGGLLWVCLSVFSLMAAEPVAENAPLARAEPLLTHEGADSCLRCHDEDSNFPVMQIFNTRHATLADPRTPFANHQCESCHGPGGDHAKRLRQGQKRPAILGFKLASSGSAEQRNQVCLNCHQSQHGQNWRQSEHQLQGLQCTSCHSIHARQDPVLSSASQPGVCFNCHQEQRTDSVKFSAHPLRSGEMACSNCHQAHSSENQSGLVQFTVNETCFQCHAEKRGPFLWEHAPAAEDCTLCHQAHGSSQPAMLKRRVPLLCQACHSASDHPGRAYTGADLEQQRAQIFLLGNSCTNCHSQVHGSNHPSGSWLNR